MIRTKAIGVAWVAMLSCVWLTMGLSGPIEAAPSDPVPYRILKEPPTHSSGKVKVDVFVDFYCPHCHHFETTVLPVLEQEFGTKLEVTAIGLPVMRDKPQTPFLLYEAARAEGKGPAMARILFRVLQDEKQDIRDPSVEAKVLKEAGLDPAAMKKRLASEDPKRRHEEGIARANRYGVRFTPTVLLDGYVLAEDTTAANLRQLIRKLLSGEKVP